MKQNVLNYDVVIIGGGTSGCSAAYNSAKNHLKTLLVEKNNFLGGLMSGGLVIPVMKSSVKDINCDFYKKLVKVSKKYNSQITYSDGNDGWFNPEILKIVLSDILSSKDISNYLDIMLETDLKDVEVANNRISKIILNSNLLSIPIKSKYFIDASGCGSLSMLAGCDFLLDNSIKQQHSLRFIVGNVNLDKFSKFILKIDKDRNITNTYRDDINTKGKLHFTTASTWNTDKIWALDKYLKKGVANKLLIDTDRAYFQIFSVAGGDGQVAFNCPRISGYNDPIEHTKSLISGYKAIYRLYNFVKQSFEGFENAIITNIAPITGYREQRRIKSKYIYKKDDLISGKTFKNPVLCSNYSIDIHSQNKNESGLKSVNAYQLPIETLISADISNLFAIGKLVGAEFEAHSALRVQKSCMSMGEAVAKYIRTKIK